MDDHIDPTAFGLDDRFAIGQPVPRSEDPVLLRGEGRYSDDVSLPSQAYAVMVRSHHAHGVIRGIDTAAAHAMPGVLAIYTAADLAAGGIGPLPPRQVMNNRDGTPMLSPVRYVLATDKVRHVGGRRHRRDDRRGQGRGRSSGRRHRAAAGGQRAAPGRCTGRPAAL
jgi:carbon-monoxide dehydrogenase large subunit